MVLLTYRHQPGCCKLQLHQPSWWKTQNLHFQNRNILNVIMHSFELFFNWCHVFKQIRVITPHCVLSLTQNPCMSLHLQTSEFDRWDDTTDTIGHDSISLHDQHQLKSVNFTHSINRLHAFLVMSQSEQRSCWQLLVRWIFIDKRRPHTLTLVTDDYLSPSWIISESVSKDKGPHGTAAVINLIWRVSYNWG